MIEICPKEECTGCGACAGICPKNCISMVNYGPLKAIYPEIDQNKCIDCGLCARICPNNSKIEFNRPLKVYASWSLDNDDRESSTSGGLGSVLANYFVKRGWAAYGAVAKPGINVCHQRAISEREAALFKKSKYVHSKVSSEVFRSIKADLANGMHVLFTGTPCQIAGIKNATKNHPNLTTVDIICHGVPPLHVLREHIKMVVGDTDSIDSFTTRDKEGYFLTLMRNGKIEYRKPFPTDEYLNGFQYSLFSRDNCYNCKYARPERQSDITIGDFWGLGKTEYPHKKVSVILVNTEKGRKLIDEVRNRLFLDERSLEEAVTGNSQLQKPSKPHKYRNFFLKYIDKLGYPSTIKLALLEFRIKSVIFNILIRNKYFKERYYNSRNRD